MKIHLRLILFNYLIIIGCSEENKKTSDFYIYGELDTTDVVIGDVMSFQVWARGSGDRKIEFPPLIIENNNISISEGKILENEFKDDRGVEFQLTFWDTGNFQIPIYNIEILTEEGKKLVYPIQLDPSQIKVHSLLTEAQPKLKDLKPPVPIPTIIPWRNILSILGILFSLIGLVWMWSKRIHDENKKIEIVIPRRPPFEIAIEKLETLSNENPTNGTAFKKYYEDLSYLVREYVENQYFFRAIEMTTSEIEEAKFVIPVSNKKINEVILILKRADLAKFAKFVPSISSCKDDLRVIHEFVLSTKLSWVANKNGVKPMEVI